MEKMRREREEEEGEEEEEGRGGGGHPNSSPNARKDQMRCSSSSWQAGSKKGKFLLPSPFVSYRPSMDCRLHDVHPHWGIKSTLLSPLNSNANLI